MRNIDRAKRFLEQLKSMDADECIEINSAVAKTLVWYFDHLRLCAEEAINDANKARIQKMKEALRADDMEIERDEALKALAEMLSDSEPH